MEHIAILAKELNLPKAKVKAAVELIDNDNTVPFIARYRKEMTGGMDETVLRTLIERLNYLRNLDKRKGEILSAIEEQGKLTKELQEKITAAKILQEVEDLYLPYKQKRKTRASIAKEKGLEPLALLILSTNNQIAPEILAKDYLNDEAAVNTIEEALKGAADIIAEIISDDAQIRQIARHLTWEKGIVVAKAIDDDLVSPFEMYYHYEEAVKKIPPHRILAINRGESEKALQVKIAQPEELLLQQIAQKYSNNLQASCRLLVEEAQKDSLKRLIAPAIEREIRAQLTEIGEMQAIKVFGQNLHNLLLQPPIKGRIVLGVDPGFRTGCKLAVVDDTGKVLEVGVMYPHPPQKKYNEAKKIMSDLIERYHVNVIAIGNGTASRESETLVADVIKDHPQTQYIIVSEAGASVYSASKLAKEEFPDYDLSLRSAVSIARRLQDPLAELVKIEPKAVGVGQYQHDINQKLLEGALTNVVEDCVNRVGVDLNTASPSLLSYIAGINMGIAKNIVAYREENGKFTNRKQLMKVSKLGEKAFNQCAGFLRIADGDNPLDATSVHPESYKAANAMMIKLCVNPEDIRKGGDKTIEEKIKQTYKAKSLKESISNMAKELEIGEMTLEDIIGEMKKPARDPREDAPPVIFRNDVKSFEDLKIDMELEGTVRNVVDFGAFVDIGVKNDGLVHISQMSDKYIKHPMDVVSVGDTIKVKIISIDHEKMKVGLTMKI